MAICKFLYDISMGLKKILKQAATSKFRLELSAAYARLRRRLLSVACCAAQKHHTPKTAYSAPQHNKSKCSLT